MSYENAPATKMLNTHCCACARPLVDAASVTAGLGPECRKRHGVPSDLPEEVRERANKLIYQCAKDDVAVEVLQAAVVELALLGCTKLANRISKRAGRIVVTVTEDAVDVSAPYSESFLRARGPGRWVRDAKVTRYQHADAYKALTAVREAFGERVLVRLERGDDASFFQADDDRLDGTLSGIAADAPKPAEAKVEFEGYPKKVGGEWCVHLDGATGTKGALVAVFTKGGKSWVARLDREVTEGVWSTTRTKVAVPEGMEGNRPAPKSPCPAPRAEVKWHGTPTKVGGEWGVRISHDLVTDEEGVWQWGPQEGDTVRVTARSGKSWVTTLAEDATLNLRYRAWTAPTRR